MRGLFFITSRTPTRQSRPTSNGGSRLTARTQISAVLIAEDSVVRNKVLRLSFMQA